MNNRRGFILTGIVLVLGLLIWFLRRGPAPAPSAQATPSPAVTPSVPPPSTKEIAPAATAPIPAVYPPWHGGPSKGLDDPRWKIVDERDKRDPAWQGKMPIEFYGKVVDEKGQPVVGAAVKFVWTDLSSEGASKRETKSDGSGLFELRGVRGKNLGVEIGKEGYYTGLQKQYGFEYAFFSDEHFYDPDPKTPVLFYLRKKGEAEPLIYREQEVKVSAGSRVKVSIGGQAQLVFALMSNQHPRRGRWEAEVTIEGGGFVPATEEFIVEAPTTGYQPTMTIGPQTPKPPTWQLYQGGSFYLKMGENYGRLDIEMIPGNDWFRMKTWINPKRGSRSLEYDPKKQASNP
jgi:hypothetical protein